jgi:hypothetical protein
MTKLEKEIEKALRDMIAKHGGKCLKWVCPGWSGVPDRIILLPGGRVLFAETKRPKGGQVSKMQVWWGEQLRLLGFWSVVIKDMEDVKWLELVIKSEKGATM